MKTRCAFAFLFLMLPVAAPALAQTPPPDVRASELRSKLARSVQQAAAEFDGVMGVAIKDLSTGDTFFANADTVFPTASAIKIPVLIELLRQAQAGTLRLDERIELKKSQTAAGSGVLQNFSDGGSALSLYDLAVLMITLSDNTATNLLIDRVGLQSVNDNLLRLGMKQTRLLRRMLDTESSRASRENVSTPREMIALLEMLDAGKALDPKHSQLALEILKMRKTSPMTAALPSDVRIASKTGSLAGVRCEAAIVYVPNRPFAIAVMTTYAQDDNAAQRAITDVTRRAFEYFDRIARSNAFGVRQP